MNVIVISLSIVLICCNINIINGTFLFLLRYQLVMEEYSNSFFNSEIIIEGPKAEEIYFMERADQIKNLENAIQKKEKLEEKYKSAKKLSIFDINPTKAALKGGKIAKIKYDLYSINEKIDKLEKELGKNKFCSEPDICQRAFRNSFFTKKNHWILEDNGSSKTKCVEKTIVIQKNGKSFADERKYVKCKTKNDKDGEKDPDVFLEGSTRYVPGKNLKYFALVDDKGYMKPVAYLMNSKEPKSMEIPIEDGKVPLLGEKGSRMDSHS